MNVVFQFPLFDDILNIGKVLVVHTYVNKTCHDLSPYEKTFHL